MTEVQDYIGYADLIDHAMREVVRGALAVVSRDGLRGDHHCYITFRTTYPGVKIPPSLRQQYPDEMTIVLQHQFWDLSVDDKNISVSLSFNYQKEKLVIPLAALTAYADPGVKFGLQFRRHGDQEDEPDLLESKQGGGASGNKPPGLPETAEVISLDTFRKKD